MRSHSVHRWQTGCHLYSQWCWGQKGVTFHRKTSVPTDPWLASVRESVGHHAVSVMGSPWICRRRVYVACRLKLNQSFKKNALRAGEAVALHDRTRLKSVEEEIKKKSHTICLSFNPPVSIVEEASITRFTLTFPTKIHRCERCSCSLLWCCKAGVFACLESSSSVTK